jgi:hypothetical protein
VASQELGEPGCGDRIRLGARELAESGVVRSRSIHESVLTGGSELREEALFLDPEVGLELPGEAPPQLVPSLRQRFALRVRLDREADSPSQHERPVMVVGERLQVRVSLHVSALLPA